MTRTRRTRETMPAWQCAPRRGRAAGQVGVLLVADDAGLRARLSPPYSPEQAALIANAVAADTLRAVQTLPGGRPRAGRIEHAFDDLRRQVGPGLLVGAEFPQVSALMLADAAALLGDFDAVLGLTTGDGWWAFGLRDPAHSALLSALPQSLASAAALTVAALRLGLRVAMLPTMQEVGAGADVHAVAERCLPDSNFVAAVARLTPAGSSGR